MFPKDLTSLAQDIPAVTKANYTSDADKTLAGDPGVQRPGSSAQIFIPHLGGVYEYFLKGIQTALRPKGFGESALSGISTGVVPGLCVNAPPPYCNVENLLPYFGNDRMKAEKASQICNGESGGNPFLINDGCLTGKFFDYSVGLFQYNLASAPHRCPGAFSAVDEAKKTCTIAGEEGRKKLEACVKKYQDPIENINKAVALSGNGTHWEDWSVAAVCGIK